MRNFLIIRPGALGDTLMLVPSITFLRDLTGVTVIGTRPGIDFIRPLASSCIDYECREVGALFMENEPWEMRSFEIPPVDRIAAFLNDPGGMVYKNLKALYPGAAVSIFPGSPPPGTIHVASYLSGCLQLLEPALRPEQVLREALTRPLIDPGWDAGKRSGIVLHPGSGGSGKNHPPPFWKELAGNLKGTCNGGLKPENRSITVLLGPAEEPFAGFFAEGPAHEDADILISPGRDELISALKRAALYIGHDSGITHLSAMLGTPTIALFRRKNASIWRPLGPVVKVIGEQEASPRLMKQVLEAAGPFAC